MTEVIESGRDWARNGRYRLDVDRLIGLAERAANAECGTGPRPPIDIETWARRWNRAFHKAMDEMAAERGIRRQAWQGA